MHFYHEKIKVSPCGNTFIFWRRRSVAFHVHNRFAFLFVFFDGSYVSKPDAPADEQKREQILKLPDILAQNQRAEDTGKHGLGKLDDKQL